MKTAVGYVRVSRVQGREGDSFQSPTKQRDEIEMWAKLRGVRVVDVYEELDASGKEGSHRPELAAAMKRVEQGDVDGLVVAKLSRFGRSVPDGLKLVKRIHDAGGEFAALDLGIDPTTSAGKLVLTFFLALAEWELEQRRDEWREVRRRAHADGVHLAPAPVGYTKSRRKRLQRDPATADAVLRAFERRMKGDTLAAIADGLREAGVQISRAGVRELLHNRAYIGEAGGDGWLPAHEAIVPVEVFEAVQSRVGAKPIHDGTIAAQGMLTRLIYCAGCGQRLAVGASKARRDGTKPARYVCRGYSKDGRCPAPGAAMAAVVDDYVRECITTALADGTLRATQDAIARYNAVAERVTDAEDELEMWMADEDSKPGVRRKMIQTAEARLDAARAALAETPAPESAVEPDSLLWDKWDIEDERAFCRQVISEVRLRRGGKGGAALPIHERIEIRWAGHDDFDTTVYARGAEMRATAARLRAA